MNYYSRIQQTIDYIDKHISENITLEELAQIACLSKYYYHRLFTALVGESVMSYIRKRRLGRAARQLGETTLRIIDIALDNGFEFEEVFIRAFTKYFGITPAKYRKVNMKINISDKISILGLVSESNRNGIQPKIVVHNEIVGVGMKLFTTYEENQEKQTIYHFHENLKARRHEISGVICPDRIYGICEEGFEEDGLIHTAFVEVGKQCSIPKDMEKYVVAPSRYLVFSHNGSIQDIVKTYHYIYHDWLPASEYELSKTGKDLQIYDSNKYNGSIIDMDICVPID